MSIEVIPVISHWGRFSLYSFFIDAPEPALIDTGVTVSPDAGIAPSLAEIGRSAADIRWILLTHGHIDHIGGAHALWEMTDRKAQVVLHAEDAHLLSDRQAHVDLYLRTRARYLQDPDGVEKQKAATEEAISGEMEPTLLVQGGERLSLGTDATIAVHHIPGHTLGSVAYEIVGQGDLFVGDAAQGYGAAAGFPGYELPSLYRRSLLKIRDEIQPTRIFLGHPYRDASGSAYEIVSEGDEAARVLNDSLTREAEIQAAVKRHLNVSEQETDSPYAPFTAIADELGYTGDPTLEPAPFFTSLNGYLEETKV